MTKIMDTNSLTMKYTSEEDKSTIITEEKQERNLPIGLDNVISLVTSVAIPYAVFEFAVKISSYNGGAAILQALKGFGIGGVGVKGGIATLLLGAGTTYGGTQKMLSFIGGKVLKADYSKGEKTKEELIEHIIHLPISKALQCSLIKQIKKF
ncbi:hypothetical protein LQF35_02635 [Peribacillus sp. N3]|nr:hypothetical protein [Peribacillus castrilensis]